MEEVLTPRNRQFATAGAGRTARSQRTVLAARNAEVDHPLTAAACSLWDRDDMTRGTGNGAGLQIDLKLALAHAPFTTLAFRHVREHRHTALLHILAGLLITVGAVPKDPLRTALLGLCVDQRLGVRTVMRARVTDLHRRDQGTSLLVTW